MAVSALIAASPVPPKWRAPTPWEWGALCIHDGYLRDAAGKVLRRVGMGEGSWSANTGNGYFGGMQFSAAAWARAGGSVRPDLASPREQLYRAWVTWRADGLRWSMSDGGEWGDTATACGLR